MKNKKKLISAFVAAVLCTQCMAIAPLTASAAIEVPQKVQTTQATEGDTEIPSDDAAGEITSINLGGDYKGSYQIIFDMSLSGALHTDPADKGASNDTYISFNGGKTGPYIISSGYNAATDTQTFTWQTTSNGGSFDMVIGQKYHFVISVENGSTDAGKGTLEVTDASGNVQKLENLNLRNYSSTKDSSGGGVKALIVSNLKKEPTANIVISDVIVKSSTPEAVEVSLTQPVIGSTKGETKTISLTSEENIIEIDPYQSSEISYSADAILNGAVSSDYTADIKFDLQSEETAFSLDKTNKKLIIDNKLPVGEYKAVLTAQVTGDDETIVECPVTFVKADADIDGIKKAFESRINVYSADPNIVWNPDSTNANHVQFDIKDVYEDLQLPTTWGEYEVTWESNKPEVIDNTGKVIPEVEKSDVVLTASIDVDGQTISKDFNITVRGAKVEVDKALAAVVMQDDKNLKVKPEAVTTDFNISAPTYKGNHIVFTYDEPTGKIVTDNATGRATINPSLEGNDAVTLTVTASYVKDGVTVVSDSTNYDMTITVSPKSVVDELFADKKVEDKLLSQIFTNADTGAAIENVDGKYYITSDINLPSEINGVKIKDWKVENDFLQLSKDGKKAEILGSDIATKNGTISGTAVSMGHEIEFSKDITVELSKDMADKYIVRCDAAAAKNFSSLPEDGEIVRDDIDLPTKGIFGSDIKWASSVPTSISNSGAVKKQSSAKKVNLTATITKGNAEKATYAIKGLVVPSKTGSTSTSSSGGSSGSGGGSSYNTNSTVSSTGNRASATEYKGTLTPNTSLQKGDVTTAEVSAFTDLSAAPWAKQAITHLYNKGIINGKTNAAFAPNDDITRAEFAKIVVKAFGLEDTSANVSQFSDVSPSDWYYTAVASAYNKGIIKGYEDGRFGVNDKITRQDMAVIIYRAAQVAGKTIAEVNSEIAFADSADIAAYATDAVKTLQKGGVINGMTATTFAPSQTATRAQAAQMIYGIVK